MNIRGKTKSQFNIIDLRTEYIRKSNAYIISKVR